MIELVGERGTVFDIVNVAEIVVPLWMPLHPAMEDTNSIMITNCK